MRCRLIATTLSFLLICSTIGPALAADPTGSAESAAFDSYVSDMKRLLQANWHPRTDSRDGLLVTKVKLSLNRSGKIKQCEIVQPSKSTREDRSVQNFLKSFRFEPLPNKAKQFEMHLSMMTDGRMNMVASDSAAPTQPHDYHLDIGSGKQLDQSDPFAPYLEDLRKSIRNAWFPPKINEPPVAIVLLIIDRQGNITDAQLTRSCGLSIADQSAIQAIENAAPFRPLPQSFEGSRMEVEIAFDFKLLYP